MASSKGTKQKKPRKKAARGGHSADGGSNRGKALDLMRDSPEFDDVIILNEHPGVEKMSEVLLEYAKPLIDQVPTNDGIALRKALGVSAICWNAALASRSERDEMLRGFVSQMERDKEFPTEELLEILNFMIQRKLQLFRNNKRWILDYEIRSTKGDREVRVVSSLEGKQLKSLAQAGRKPWWKRLFFWLK